MRSVGGGILTFGEKVVESKKSRYRSDKRINDFRKDVRQKQSVLVWIEVAVSWLRRREGLAYGLLDPSPKLLPVVKMLVILRECLSELVRWCPRDDFVEAQDRQNVVRHV